MSFYLKNLSKDADTKDIVIAIPSYFKKQETDALVDAIKIAELNVKDFIYD